VSSTEKENNKKKEVTLNTHQSKRPWKPTQCNHKPSSPTHIPEVKENVDTDLSLDRNLHKNLGK